VKKKYESHAQHLKDKAKENPDHGKDASESKGHKKRLFAYSFAIMDLQSSLYLAFGSSMKSEREAYDRAMDLLSTLGLEMDSIRLDRYYSSPSYVDKLGDTKVFVIPKKNATLNGSQKWKDTMKELVADTMSYL
jgi:transposase